MNNFLVSIIIPIYNVEKYLNRCVDSIINQTYSNLEIILVNDESPDKSSVICEDYKLKDLRVKVIHKKNGGLSDARNAGLEIASGDYIMFLDSDDYIENNMIESLLKVAIENQSDIVLCGFYADFVDVNEQLIFSRERKGIKGTFTKSDFCEIPLDNELIGLLGYAWNKLYRKQVIDENKHRFIKGLSLVEDIVFNGPILSECNKISFSDETLVHYMQRPRETLGSKFYSNYYDLKQMAMNSVESMLYKWGKNEQEINTVLGQMGYNILKSTTKLLSKAENYTKDEKDIYLKSLLNKSDVQDILLAYSPKNHKDRLIKFLMLKRQSNLLLYMYSGR